MVLLRDIFSLKQFFENEFCKLFIVEGISQQVEMGNASESHPKQWSLHCRSLWKCHSLSPRLSAPASCVVICSGTVCQEAAGHTAGLFTGNRRTMGGEVVMVALPELTELWGALPDDSGFHSPAQAPV